MSGSDYSPLLDAESVMDSIQEAIVIIDRHMNVVKVNRSALQLIGRPAEEVTGRPCREVVNCFACHHNCPFQRILETGKSERQFNIDKYYENEEPRKICLNSNPIRDADGRIAGIVENIRDVGHINSLIQELNQLNLQIVSDRNKSKAVLDSIPEGVYTIDANWRITSFNKAAQEITGFSERDAIGRYCYKVLNSNICMTACPLKETLETGLNRQDVEGQIMNRRGESRKLLFSTTVYHDPNRKVTGGVESIRDMGLLQELLDKVPQRREEGGLIGSDARMVQILNLIEMVKDSDSTVLLTGESGTGKNLLAHELHRRSHRRDHPFVKISCASLAETLLESELFGHAKGSFTGATKDKPGKFEIADGGTVFLDEIGEISPHTQVKLLRFLQEQEFERVGSNRTIQVDVRIIAATNRDLLQMVRDGEFREDLYYRLAVIPIRLPALRERPGDIPAIMAAILDKLARRLGQPTKSISPDVMEIFLRYPWPGNIRELENVLEHGFVCSPGKIITTDALPAQFREPLPAAPTPAGDVPPPVGPRDPSERELILEALQQHGWRMSETAEALGMNRTTLWRKMRKYNIGNK